MASLKKTAAKPKSETKVLTAAIIAGPTRTEIYHESEFCIDHYGGRRFYSKFQIRERPYLHGDSLRACITGVEHADDRANVLRLSGYVNAHFVRIGQYEIYPFTAYYDCDKQKGHFNIRVPRTLDVTTKF